MHFIIDIVPINLDKNQLSPARAQNDNDDDNIFVIFQTLDLDGTGKINFDEFKAGCFAQTEEEQIETFNKMDKDGDGFINYQEFKEAFQTLKQAVDGNNGYQNQPQQNEEHLLKIVEQKEQNDDKDDDILAIFQALDADGTGKINFEEFKKGCASQQIDEIQKDVFINMDEDGDGFLDFQEFKKAYQILTEPVSAPKYNMMLPSAPSISAFGPENNEQYHSEGVIKDDNINQGEPGAYY